MKYQLEFNSVPPSQNARRGEHWSRTHKRKRQWMDDIVIRLLQQKVPKSVNCVHATASIRLPKNRRRDEGNFRDVLEKALGDALQLGWLDDDTPEYFTFGEVTFETETGAARTIITIETT